MAVINLIYIFDEKIIMPGLFPFDFLIRLFLSIIIPENGYNYFNWFIIFNPLLAIVGVAAIIPISAYLDNKEKTESLVKNFIQSLFFGLVGMVLLFLTIILFNYILSEFFILVILSEGYFYVELSSLFNLLFLLAVSFLLISILIFYLYNKVWTFLIIRGVRKDIGFSDQMRLLRKTNSRGMIGFTVLLLIHSFLQVFLFYIINPIPSARFLYDIRFPLPAPSIGSALGPVEFLIFAIFEVGFYLFLIIYQIVQLEKCEVAYRPIIVQSKEEIRTPITNTKIVSRTQLVANEILANNIQGINIKHNGQLLFSEFINDTSLLFYQDSSSNIPVAMNYACHYPQPHRKISPTDQLSIIVPTIHQMQQFINLTAELKLQGS